MHCRRLYLYLSKINCHQWSSPKAPSKMSSPVREPATRSPGLAMQSVRIPSYRVPVAVYMIVIRFSFFTLSPFCPRRIWCQSGTAVLAHCGMFPLATASSKPSSELIFLEARWLIFNGRKVAGHCSMFAGDSSRKYRTEGDVGRSFTPLIS
jgi:hypothetical protein